jgi:hypothetical protein
MNAEHTATPPADEGACTWFVVSQCKSNRVVYFTDDTDYAPPMHGDWYYVSPHQGELPDGMTLRNCWRWRFDGHAFVEASEPKAIPQQVALLQSNKAALLRLLHEKIDALRNPFVTSSVLGEQVRSAKLQEARAVLAGDSTGTTAGNLTYLIETAAAAACTVQDMAQRIVQQHTTQQAVLHQTESLRMHLSAAIAGASTHAELIAIRQRIMSDLAPEMNSAIKPDHTTARKHTAKPTEQALHQEQLRLSVQLREKINDLRRPCVSHYLLDDVVLKHKGQIAQAVLAQGGAIPAGVDGIVLISHAAARGQTLLAAAHEVLSEMNDTAQTLLATEQLKDAWSVRIASVQSFKDIDDLGRAITRLQLPSAKTGAQAAQNAGDKI